jgi:hypothetical protein
MVSSGNHERDPGQERGLLSGADAQVSVFFTLNNDDEAARTTL